MRTLFNKIGSIARPVAGIPAGLVLMIGAQAVLAGPSNEAILSRISGIERLQLDSLQVMDARVLGEISERTSGERLAARTREILDLDVPAIGSRSVGPDGLSPIHHYILDAGKALEPAGLELVGTLRKDVAAPVSLDRLLDEEARELPALLYANGETFPIHPLWPNGPMPSLAPREGIEGRLVYCGNGDWEAIEGMPLTGAIALLEFRGAGRMERLFSLGAKAVIVLEDLFVQYENATYLFSQTPSPFPRYFAEAEVKLTLLGLLGPDGTGPVTRIHGGQIYENRPTESIFFHLPAADTLDYRVPDSLAIDWMAARFGVNATDILTANELPGQVVTPGQELRIPGQSEPFRFPEDGLWEMVARLHDIDTGHLKAANPEIAASPLLSGQTVQIPSGEMPLAILVSIDSTSVVPDLPHGALSMANVAAALELMEFLATSPGLRIRRDVLFGFVDGDTLGGQGSRLVAEYTYLLDKSFKTKAVEGVSPEETIARYEAGLEWFRSGKLPEDEATQSWLVDEWLRPRFEEERILVAEKRIERIVGERGSEDLPSLEALERDLAYIARQRDETLLFAGSSADRLTRLMERWTGPEAAGLQEHNLGRESLMERFSKELEEEKHNRANHSHNLQTAERLRMATLGGTQPGVDAALAWKLDLSDGSPHLGINLTVASSLRLRDTPAGSAFSRTISPRLRTVAAFSASKAGWPEDFLFIEAEDRASLPLLESPGSVLYDNFWAHANYVVLPLSGESDRRRRVDTPADTWEQVNWDHFSLQARTTLSLVGAGLESLLDTRIQDNLRKRDLSRIGGKAVQFNIRSGIDARDPVPGTYVFLPSGKSSTGFAERNTEAFFGHRRGIVQISLLNGSYLMPPEVNAFNAEPRIYAYKLDRDQAVFTKVATQGQVGTKPQVNTFKYRMDEVVQRNIVLIDVYPRVFFIGSNPSNYKEVLGGTYATNVIRLEDAVIQGSPRDYAIDNPIVDFREKEREAVTVYLPPGSRIRASIQLGLEYLFVLPGPIEIEADGEARGRGFLVGPNPESEDRNILMPLTPYRIATGMWKLAANRLDIYEQYGITSKILREAVERSGELIHDAEQAIVEEDWQKALGSSREAWGILVKNFPRILKLGREAVFSVILLMALAVPGAWFLERLVIGSKGIVARLGGITAIFVAATLFLNYFHPAFQIALSPFIIVIAFTMILMSVIVIALSYSRFQVVLQKFRSSGGEVEGEEISFMSSMATAFSLGISNLKKRTFRTALTTFTVTALTFSIVGFVAVTGQDSLTRTPQPIDRTVEGRVVDPIPPVYDGLLIRSHNWRALSDNKTTAIQAEFGARFPVTVRAAYMEVEGGNSANREGVNQLLIRHDGDLSVVNAIMLFEPNEPEFSGLNRAVSNGTWFQPGDPGKGLLPDRQKIILPDTAASQLGISADMLVDSEGNLLPDKELPSVLLMNREWKVIGILDTELANRIRDVNGRSLALVDFLRSGMATNTSPGEIVTEGLSYHMDWSRLAIVPLEARKDIQATPRSVAVKIPEDKDVDAVLKDMSLRLKTEFFAAKDGEVAMVIPRARLDLAGLAKVFLPVILCILIVMNTMLGTVEERKGEVGMLGAIGLSPRQIAFLMFSESTVFSILGILFGTFGGLLFANIINTINAGGGELLTGLSFNFTSMISMALATGTGLVVLLATLIPANKAAALAAPSGMSEWQLPEGTTDGEIAFRLPFTLTRGNAVGMTAFFRQFLVNHNEPTSEDFNCREVTITQGKSDGHAFIEIETDMWLAPYDLDVAQHFTMRMQSGDREGVFVVDLQLRRFSGSEENSRRTAYNLLNLVRRQFLLWRNLKPERRTDFIEQGAQLLENAPSPEGAQKS